ncbi:hypothetical protein [Horticoccus sp. 23ND18S-11]|uniref:hypothetical protein n=1 Tax=Horticoccus sp. 23ND18S-11 TaxID=3391832 RepID=UPI0039C90746
MAEKQFLFRQAVRVTSRTQSADLSVGLNRIVDGPGNFGCDALTNPYGDRVQTGARDPGKVTRIALQPAASIAGLALTTECMIARWPEEKRAKENPEPDDVR